MDKSIKLLFGSSNITHQFVSLLMIVYFKRKKKRESLGGSLLNLSFHVCVCALYILDTDSIFDFCFYQHIYIYIILQICIYKYINSLKKEISIKNERMY
jgi:hypothetical protein